MGHEFYFDIFSLKVGFYYLFRLLGFGFWKGFKSLGGFLLHQKRRKELINFRPISVRVYDVDVHGQRERLRRNKRTKWPTSASQAIAINGMQRWLSVISRALFTIPCRVESQKSLHGNPSSLSCVFRGVLSPFSRAGHAAAWDEDRDGMWIHGGYTTFYPYISSDGAGSGVGTTVSSRRNALNTPFHTKSNI